MKKNLTALFAAIILFTSTTFANETGEPSLQIQNQFTRMFTKATGVKWEEVSNFYQVTFMEGGQYLTAYYNTSGEFQSLSRNISSTMLPLILQKGLQDKIANAWISDSFELYGKNGTEYYVTLETATDKTIYHSGSTDWMTFKKTQK